MKKNTCNGAGPSKKVAKHAAANAFYRLFPSVKTETEEPPHPLDSDNSSLMVITEKELSVYRIVFIFFYF